MVKNTEILGNHISYASHFLREEAAKKVQELRQGKLPSWLDLPKKLQ